MRDRSRTGFTSCSGPTDRSRALLSAARTHACGCAHTQRGTHIDRATDRLHFVDRSCRSMARPAHATLRYASARYATLARHARARAVREIAAMLDSVTSRSAAHGSRLRVTPLALCVLRPTGCSRSLDLRRTCLLRRAQTPVSICVGSLPGADRIPTLPALTLPQVSPRIDAVADSRAVPSDG